MRIALACLERKNGGVLPYLVLLRVGFALPPSLLTARCALTAPFHPYPAQPPQRAAGFEGMRLPPRRQSIRNQLRRLLETRFVSGHDFSRAGKPFTFIRRGLQSATTPARPRAGVVRRGGMFSVALSVNEPLRSAARTLSGTPLCGVRTFLCGFAPAATVRPSS